MSALVPRGDYGSFGLTTAVQTQSQVIENQPLASSGSPTMVLANFTNGPGVMTRFQIILDYLAGVGFSVYPRALLFSFYIDGETTPSVQFDGDLWSLSQLPAASPSSSTPYVLESDYLTTLFVTNAGGDFNHQLIFKYPIPFGQSLLVTVQNQSASGAAITALWSAVDVQLGITSIRRLKSSFTPFGTPLQIPSAVLWNSGTAYVAGNLATFNNVLYQAVDSSTNSQPPSAHWTAVSESSVQNFNTGYNLLSVNQQLWIAHMTINGQGPVNGGAYGSTNQNNLSFLESNIAVYDGNPMPGPSYPGSSPTPAYNSSGTEDFFGGSFYFTTIGSPVGSTVSIPSTPFTFHPPGKSYALRHGYCMSNSSGFMGANVSLLALTGGIRCGVGGLMRFEQGNLARANSGPISANNTWKINPTILYYI